MLKDTQKGQLISSLTNRLYPYRQVIATHRPTDFSGIYRRGVTRDPICQGYRVASLHGYFAAGGAVVGLEPNLRGYDEPIRSA